MENELNQKLNFLSCAHELYVKVSENEITKLNEKIEKLTVENEKLTIERNRYKQDYEQLQKSLKNVFMHVKY